MSRSSGVRLVLALLLVAVMFSVAGMATLYFMVGGGGPTVQEGTTLVLRPSGSLPEVAPEIMLPVADGRAMTVRGYVDLIRKARADSRVARLLIRPGSLDSPYWGKLQEIRDAIVNFKESGKPVYAYLETASDREYFLASAADQIYLLPTSTLDLTGLATYEVFLRGTFDWIGTYPDFLHVGNYKTAVNTFTEKTFTPAHQEMSASLNADQFGQMVRVIADGRRKSEDDVRQLIDRGPLLPEEALRVGLVDALAYEDELDDLDNGPQTARSLRAEDYAGVSWAAAGVSRRSRIAVINAAGTIVLGESGYDPVNGQVLGSDSVVRDIRRARNLPGVRAIVLRVDSPGGSSVASDVIWRELMITKAQNVPLVVSMSDLAASGGYYIAAAGDVIVAQPGTLTGSIGVYTGKFVTGGTLEKLGANIEVTSQGRFAEMFSPDRPFSEEERATVQASMQFVYDNFVERVAESRQTTPEKIDEVGQGRVWTGRQAREVGLVDQLGGLYDAVAVAKQRALIPADEDVELVVYPQPRSFYEVLTDQVQRPAGGAGERSSAAALLATLGPRERHALAGLLAPSRLFRTGELLKHMPYVFVY